MAETTTIKTPVPTPRHLLVLAPGSGETLCGTCNYLFNYNPAQYGIPQETDLCGAFHEPDTGEAVILEKNAEGETLRCSKCKESESLVLGMMEAASAANAFVTAQEAAGDALGRSMQDESLPTVAIAAMRTVRAVAYKWRELRKIMG